MVKNVRITNFADVRRVVDFASKLPDEVGVHDANGSIADARSLLGMMSLSYTMPVKIVSENQQAVNDIANMLVKI